MFSYTMIDTIIDILYYIELTFYSICLISSMYGVYCIYRYIFNSFNPQEKPLKQNTKHIFNTVELFDPTMEIDNFEFTHILHINNNMYLEKEIQNRIQDYIHLFQQNKHTLYTHLPMLSDLTIHIHSTQNDTTYTKTIYIQFKATTIYQKGFSPECIIDFKQKAKQYITHISNVLHTFTPIILHIQ